MPDVVIVGSGPSGMMLAAELALAGVDVAVLERRKTADLQGSRALGFHSRTIEVFDQRGIADRFLAAGTIAQTARFGNAVLDISDFPTRHPYGLGLPQNLMEPILADWLVELGVEVTRGCEAIAFAQDDAGVSIRTADGKSLRAQYLVGADGGRSLVRKTAGIEFPGWDATRSNLTAEVRFTAEPPAGIHRDEAGVHALSRMPDGDTYRVVTTERELHASGEPTLADLSAALVAAFGTDFGVHSPSWISRFTDATRQAADYRKGRVLLVGDAAHIHYPAGGQGLGLGIQDAVNLGWKLARVAKGASPETLLDSYQSERHPVASRALNHSMAQSVLQRQDVRTEALTRTIDELMAMDEPRIALGALIHGLDIAYDVGEGHPLLGRRVPDQTIVTDGRESRVFEYLHGGKPLLLDFGSLEGFDLAPWSARVQLVRADAVGPWVLPVQGEVSAPRAMLVRPDGHVAWVSDGTDAGLTAALARWIGD
jgi:3-(3-hydroxy-phenyl)propionate hydroxylase